MIRQNSHPAAQLTSIAMPKVRSLAGEFSSIVLPNKFTIHALHNPNIESIKGVVAFRTGSRDDPKGLQGLAHAAEHLLLCATKNFPSVEILDQATRSRGVVMDC